MINVGKRVDRGEEEKGRRREKEEKKEKNYKKRNIRGAGKEE